MLVDAFGVRALEFNQVVLVRRDAHWSLYFGVRIQVREVAVVDLNHLHEHLSVVLARFLFDAVVHVLERELRNAFNFAVAHQGVSFSGAGRTVREDCTVVSTHRILHKVLRLLEDLDRFGFLRKDVIEFEILLPVLAGGNCKYVSQELVASVTTVWRTLLAGTQFTRT